MDLAKLYRRVLCKTWRARMERAKESCTGGLGPASERCRDPDLASARPDLQQGEHLGARVLARHQASLCDAVSRAHTDCVIQEMWPRAF